MSRIVFLDTETTGLSDECDIWEIGLITRDFAPDDVDSPEGRTWVDTEYCWQIVPDMATAEPTGLRIGRYYERLDSTLGAYGVGWYRQTVPQLNDLSETQPVQKTRYLAAELGRLLDGATIVGAVPDFDTRHLSRWLRQLGQCGTWHYHLVDVETFAAGSLRIPPPWDFDDLLAVHELTYDEADRHTALGDARMVRDLYDAVLIEEDK